MIQHTETNSNVNHLLTVESGEYSVARGKWLFDISLTTTAPGEDSKSKATKVAGDTPSECIRIITRGVHGANSKLSYQAYRCEIPAWAHKLALKHG